MSQLVNGSNGHRTLTDGTGYRTSGGEGGAVSTLEPGWESVCRLEQLQPYRGVAALIGDTQVALFRISDPVGGTDGDALYAIHNVDPCSGAAVLSRGIVGDRHGEPVVASPIYKQSFSLVTGQCLDEPDKSVPVYRVRVCDGWVQVGLG